MVVSITDTVPSRAFGIYAYVPVGEALCAVAVEETRIKSKISAADAKAIDWDFLPVFIYPLPLIFI
jgi:hypothetical protein